MVSLRPATADDAARLLEWRNDPVVRELSFDTAEIDLDTHVAWLGRKLASATTRIFIVEVDAEPVGQVRLEAEDDQAEVHIGLASTARGRGIGREALRLALQAADELGAASVLARVKPDNQASLHAFAAAGFREVGATAEAVELVAPTR